MRIFISHSSHDAEKAAGICSVLEGDGHSCFLAPRDIRPGREYAEEIMNGIGGADILLLLLSEQSNQSPHVLREVERAGSSRIPILVYKLEEVALTKSLEYFLMTNQWIDGTEDSNYRKVSEAFDQQYEPDAALPDKKLPEREPQKKEGQGVWKRMVPVLLLLLVICGIVFAAGKTGRGGKLMTDAGGQDADAASQGADSRRQGADAASQGADSGRQDADAASQGADSGRQGAGAASQGVDNGRQGADAAVQNADGEIQTVDLSPGASVELGTYGGEPVVWRVLHASEDGEQLILVSDKILTMKAFDAAESGKYNFDGDKDYWTTAIVDKTLESRVRGSNLWCNSNIRTWLNSEKENVPYEDQAPVASAMSEKKNGYGNEAGFLHGFTEEERAVLREMELFTIGNVLMDSLGTVTDDKVFLLSQKELEWFDEADVSIYTAPTETAVEQDQTGWYEGYSLSLGVEEYLWLLRDPAEDSASKCMAVGNGSQSGEIMLEQIEAGAEGFGIRPAVCVDRQALTELIEASMKDSGDNKSDGRLK